MESGSENLDLFVAIWTGMEMMAGVFVVALIVYAVIQAVLDD